MLNNEWLMIASMANGGILFAVGGTGFKWIRRFLMPFIFGFLCLFGGFELWRCLGLWLTMSGVMHLGYGERYPYWAKFIIGCSYAATTLFLGFSWWQIITPVCFVGMFWLSNQKFSSNTFLWKIVEFMTGCLIGVTIASLIHYL